MSNYWQFRELDRLYNRNMKIADKNLAAQYIRCFNKTQKLLVDLYYDLMEGKVGDRDILVSDLYKYNKYYDLLNNINANLTELGLSEQEIYSDTLSNMYIRNSELISNQLGKFNIEVSNEKVKSAINTVWCQDGKNWSDRIWDNKQLLNERIQNGIVDCVARGTSKDELVKQLQRDFNVGFNQADRIARTELSYVQNQSTKDRLTEYGIEKYEILATDDERTCEDCFGEEGAVYNLADAKVGINYPPFHANCRCVVLAVIE